MMRKSWIMYSILKGGAIPVIAFKENNNVLVRIAYCKKTLNANLLIAEEFGSLLILSYAEKSILIPDSDSFWMEPEKRTCQKKFTNYSYWELFLSWSFEISKPNTNSGKKYEFF